MSCYVIFPYNTNFNHHGIVEVQLIMLQFHTNPNVFKQLSKPSAMFSALFRNFAYFCPVVRIIVSNTIQGK